MQSERNPVVPITTQVEHRPTLGIPLDPARIPAASGVARLLGESEPMRGLRALVGRIAPTRLAVLISGESGTGKEVVAKAIHESGRSAAGPFVTENCAAIPVSLFESLFFGHSRGSFTGAERDHPGLFRQASGGTLFLDEITEMPPGLQAKLLRVLQEREVRPVGSNSGVEIDCRIIAATNRNPETAIADGLLREDLFYRLAGMSLDLPPLRQRKEDIPLLAMHFARKAASLLPELGGIVKLPRLAPETVPYLYAYSWPGNVRELGHEIERALALADDACVTPGLLSCRVMRSARAAGIEAPLPEPEAGECGDWLLHTERAMIQHAVCISRGNLADAARAIGWNRQKLYRRIRKLRVRCRITDEGA